MLFNKALGPLIPLLLLVRVFSSLWRIRGLKKQKLINLFVFIVLMKKTFHVLIEQDEDGGYIGKVPELQGCLSQGDTLDELMKNIKEAIELCLEVQTEAKKDISEEHARFIGVQEIIV